MFLTISRKLSVPICGFAFIRISSGAPNSANFSKTYLQSGSFIRVVSFPSEKVPAPPSPNCTLDSVLSSPPFQYFSTSLIRSSTGFPLSIITGLYPYSASKRPQNIPAGPKPAITTSPSRFKEDISGVKILSETYRQFLFRQIFFSVFLLNVFTYIEYTK